ncbi:FUSC family protein [Streptomyces sasae]|uniref:FUSC family protein n=1 Tax=Streptomyces sasae TaxID=1266772 RepID=UPI00292F094F|nr:FUSC family protein [Streptomyces sasae]
MGRLYPFRSVAAESGRRRSAAVARVLSPRGALALRTVDGAFSHAVQAAIATALPVLVLLPAGRAEYAVYTILGSFSTTFGQNLPYPRRARVLAVVGPAMTACVGCGAALAAWARPWEGAAGAAAVVAAMAAVAGLAKFACDATRLGGLGAVLLLFSFAVAANAHPSSYADVLPRTALAATGAAVVWAVAMAGRFVHPDRPQRLAVAAALRAVAELLEATGAEAESRPVRNRATAAVLQAYESLGLMPSAATGRGVRGSVCVRLTDLSWSLLTDTARRPPDGPAEVARNLRRQVALLVDPRRPVPALLPELLFPFGAVPTGTLPSSAKAGSEKADLAARRAAVLLRGRRHGHAAVLLVPALRMTLGTGLAGALALALGLGHGYWAAISAAAVLHAVNVRTAAQRAVQRTVGTAAGLALALGVLATAPSPTALVLVIVLLEFLLEYVVARNYGLGVVFLTPLALLLAELAAPEPARSLVLERAVGSVLGIAVGLCCALLVVHDRAAVRAERAMAVCVRAAERAERALAKGREASLPVVRTRLAAAVVELREADDAAAGELWSAEIDPTELTAVEQRAYHLLDRLSRRERHPEP